MSLDATIYCDCMERGKLQSPLLSEWQVYIDESGARVARTDDPEEDFAFADWNVSACAHEDGVLLHHRLGNVAEVGLIRATLTEHREKFPLILTKVVYDGLHSGDHIPIGELSKLAGEVGALSSVQPVDPLTAEVIRDFEKMMIELITTAKSVEKPISF